MNAQSSMDYESPMGKDKLKFRLVFKPSGWPGIDHLHWCLAAQGGTWGSVMLLRMVHMLHACSTPSMHKPSKCNTGLGQQLP